MSEGIVVLLQAHSEGIGTLGGDGEVFTLPIDHRGDQHGISLGFVVEQVKFFPLQNRATGTGDFLPLGNGLVLATIIQGWGFG